MGDTAQTVLHGIDLDINEGDMVAIMGASGSGKSTMMNIIGLLDRPSQGDYYIHGKDAINLKDDQRATLRNKTIGFVFQQFFLLAKLNAERNVALPLVYRGERPQVAKERALAMLDRVGMSDRSHHRPNELSGGQQQRVAIARALVGEPDIVLADEPTGALDSSTGKDVMDLFAELHRKEKKTIIVITHDPNIGEQCERIIHLKDGYIVKETHPNRGY